jgi:hypothetical protein
MRLNLAVFAQTDFLHGDLLDQAFDLRPDNDPIVHGLGSVFEDVGGKLRAYTFAIQRLRVTPLVCKP